jgi:ATP-dependent Clp protease ATP-binding subunit ClpC
VRLRAKIKRGETKALEEELRSLQKDDAVAAEDFGKTQEQVAGPREPFEESGGDRRPMVAEVTAEDIAEVVSRATGIPVSQLTEEERERLLRLEGQLHERIVGQEEAVEAVAEAIRRARAGLSTRTGPSAASCSSVPPASARPSFARARRRPLRG